MKHSYRKLLALSVAVAAASITNSARATGPDYQYIADGGAGGGAVSASTLNDVAMLSGPGGIGTGTVIGATLVNLSSTVQYEVFSVLTANHVAVTTPTTVSFGAGYTGVAPAISQANGVVTAPGGTSFLLTGGVNATFQTYSIPVAAAGGLTEDVSIMQASVGPLSSFSPAQTAELNLLTANANIPSLATGFGATAGNQSNPFTQYGYGRGGVFNIGAALNASTVANNYTGLSGPSRFSSQFRRFQNNTSINLQAPAIPANFPNYFEPLVNFNPTPTTFTAGVGNGQGDGMPGDSGGPMMTSTAGANVTVIPNFGANSGNATPVAVTDTNSDSAVYVGVSSGPLNGFTYNSGLGNGVGVSDNAAAPFTVNTGVPLLNTAQTNTILGLPANTVAQGSLEWANGFGGAPLSVPEPTSLSLLALGGAMLLRRRRSRA